MSEKKQKFYHAKWKYYKIKGNKIERTRKFCPRCGEGIFMAEHENRYSCGKCGYTEYK